MVSLKVRFARVWRGKSEGVERSVTEEENVSGTNGIAATFLWQ